MSRAREAVIALDQGSSSSRALALGPDGRLLAKSQAPIKTFHPRPGWVEHDATDIALTQERALKAVLAKLPKAVEVLGLGVACQRSTVVFWDRATGKPAARAPSWQDGRAASIVAPLQDRQAQAHEITGLYLTPYYSAPKIRYCLDDEPALKRLLDAGRLLCGPVSTYLVWRLTKGEVFAADPSTAQRMMLMSLRTLDWDDTMLSLFGIPREILPRILPSSGDWGTCVVAGRRLALRAVLGDQQAAVLGLGGVDAGSAVANYGTGAFLLLNTGAEQHRIPGLLTSVGWKRGDAPPAFLQEGTVHAAGTSFDWLRDNFGLLKGPAEIERLCRSSKTRVLALQAIGGLGAPRWDYVTKTAWFGLTAQTRREDLVRGVAEGIAFLVADIAAAMRAGGLRLSEVRAAGGLSRVPYLMQFQADLLGAELRRCREAEATALGVASLAAEAAGAPWAEGLRAGGADRVFTPQMTWEASLALHSCWAKFVAAQAALSREIQL